MTVTERSVHQPWTDDVPHCPIIDDPDFPIVTAEELGYGQPTYLTEPPHLIGGMTVQTDFHNWQESPIGYDSCSPLLMTWLDHLMRTWGGSNWGCHLDRPVTGGSAPSSHASGAALDWGYSSRSAVDLQVLPLFINNSQELGVQAIHDYVNNRIWRTPAYRGCSPTDAACGWKIQDPPMAGVGSAHLHIECTAARWGDTRPFDDIDGTPGDPTATPPKPGTDPKPGMLDCLLQEERARLAKLGLPLPP